MNCFGSIFSRVNPGALPTTRMSVYAEPASVMAAAGGGVFGLSGFSHASTGFRKFQTTRMAHLPSWMGRGTVAFTDGGQTGGTGDVPRSGGRPPQRNSAGRAGGSPSAGGGEKPSAFRQWLERIGDRFLSPFMWESDDDEWVDAPGPGRDGTFAPVSRKVETVAPGSDLIMRPRLGESALLEASMQEHVDRKTGSTVVSGNGVRLMKNGASSFPERYRMMREATVSINLQTLIFHSDATGWRTARLLAKKAGEGVRVRVIYDWISSADSDRKMFEMMEEAGVELQAFNTPLDYKWHGERRKDHLEHMDGAFKDFWKMAGTLDIKDVDKWIAEKGEDEFEFWKGDNEAALARLKEYPPLLHKLNNRWHMKLLTVDGRKAMVGGMNVGSEYANGGALHRDLSLGKKSFSAQAFRDTDVMVEGPVVTEVNEIFAENWGYAGGTDPGLIRSENPQPARAMFGVDTRFITHQPREIKDRNIEEWYYLMLANAKQTAYLTNAYFLPHPEFIDALIAAAKRGVDVRILTNSVGTNDLPILTQGGRLHYRKLLEGGVRIYDFREDNPLNFTTLHAKTVVFDGEVSTIGSHNLDARSFAINSEDTLVVHDRPFGLGMHRMFKRDLEFSNEVTLADLERETPADKMAQWFAGRVLKDLL